MNNTIVMGKNRHTISLDTPHVSNLTLNMKGRSQHNLNLTTPVAHGVVGSYLELSDKPKINDVELIGNLSFEDLGLIPLSIYDIDIITGYASTEASLIDLTLVGGEVSLFNDILLSQPLTISHDTTLDLCGSTIASESDAFVVDNCTLTLKGGIINSSGNAITIINGGEVIVDSGTFIAEDTVFNLSDTNSTLTINGGTIISTNGFVVHASGNDNTIVLNNGYLESNIVSEGYESCCVHIVGDNVFTMNGGAIKSTDGCGILMRAGTVVISNGEITAEKENHSPGYVDDDNPMSATAIIYDEMPDQNMSLTILDGTFTGADHAIEILSENPSVIITGGTFTPDFPE